MKKYFYLTVFLAFLLLDGQVFTASSPERVIKKIAVHTESRSRNLQLTKSHYSKHDNHFNPFRPMRTKKIINKENADWQKFSKKNSNSIRFFGVIKSKRKIWALVSRNRDVLLHVNVGDFLDNSAFKIIDIKEDFLRYEENVFIDGKWLKNTKDIYLITKR